MKKMVFWALILAISLLLCACANQKEGAETITAEDEGTSQSEYRSTEKEENELLGSWYSDAEGVIVVFSEQGKMETYIIEWEYNENPTVEILTEQYNLIEDSQLETYYLD